MRPTIVNLMMLVELFVAAQLAVSQQVEQQWTEYTAVRGSSVKATKASQALNSKSTLLCNNILKLVISSYLIVILCSSHL